MKLLTSDSFKKARTFVMEQGITAFAPPYTGNFRIVLSQYITIGYIIIYQLRGVGLRLFTRIRTFGSDK